MQTIRVTGKIEFDKVLLEKNIGLAVHGPSTVIYGFSFRNTLLLTRPWRFMTALSYPLQRLEGPKLSHLWSFVGTPPALGHRSLHDGRNIALWISLYIFIKHLLSKVAFGPCSLY